MRTPLLAVAMCLAALPSARAQPATPERDLVLRVRLADHAITPITARFLGRALTHAERLGARYFVLELDTPGGVVDATRDIVRGFLASKVKVVVYVSPPGARAASAGLFLALASDVAAMAPGTNIGAAHPVQLGGLPAGPEPGQGQPSRDVLGEKILNDTLAWARALAELRGRNGEIAVAAVAASRSLTAEEAKREGLVDFVANDFDDLLARLEATGAEVQTLELSAGQRLLAALASPNLAFVLLLLGVYALLFEFSAGGFGVAGVLGAVCLILSFVGLAVLPLNYAGVALLAVGLALLIAEAFVTSFGLLTLGGVSCLILGGLMLIDSPPGFLRVSTTVVIPAALATGAIALFLLGNTLKARRAGLRSGSETLRGETAVAEEAFHRDDGHYGGTVRFRGEFWNAVSPVAIAAHDQVRIVDRHGLTLDVKPHGLGQGPSS